MSLDLGPTTDMCLRWCVDLACPTATAGRCHIGAHILLVGMRILLIDHTGSPVEDSVQLARLRVAVVHAGGGKSA